MTLRLQFLGTGGSQPIPLPTCDCRVCRAAADGPPDARRGYSLFLPAVGAVIDTPEQAADSLVRWDVDRLDRCLLTHWHPDHAGGVRALSMRPTDREPDETFQEAKRRTAPTLVTTRAVYDRACETVGVLPYLVSEGFVETRFLDDEPATLSASDGGPPVTVRALPYRLDDDAPREATAFVFERAGVRLAVVADDARRFDVSRLPDGLDALVFECGTFEHGPDGERLRSPRLETDDLSHEAVLERVAAVDAGRTFLSHLGHQYARTHADYRALSAAHADDPDAPDGVVFPHDGQTVEIRQR